MRRITCVFNARPQHAFRDGFKDLLANKSTLLHWYIVYAQPEHIICAGPCTVLGLQHEDLMEGHWWIVIYLWKKVVEVL